MHNINKKKIPGIYKKDHLGKNTCITIKYML